MWTRIALALIAFPCGAWMLFDALHVLLRGKYFGPPRPGPWARPFESLGINPFHLGPLFLTVGLAWLLAALAALAHHPSSRPLLAACALATLFYLPLGTLCSLLTLLLLYLARP